MQENEFNELLLGLPGREELDSSPTKGLGLSVSAFRSTVHENINRKGSTTMKAARDWVDLPQILRFVIAGGTNTLLTFALYQVLLFVVSYGMAYAITWLCAVLFSMIVYPDHVFRAANTSTLTRIAAGAIYIGVYCAGLGMMGFLQDVGISPRISIILVLPLTASLVYCSLRLLFSFAQAASGSAGRSGGSAGEFGSRPEP